MAYFAYADGAVQGVRLASPDDAAAAARAAAPQTRWDQPMSFEQGLRPELEGRVLPDGTIASDP